MKKIYLLLLTLVAFVTSSNAAIKVIYNQDFESAVDATAAGWASPSVAAGLSITSDGESKVLSFAPSGNDRSAHTLWGADLIKTAGVSTYTVSFEFCAKAWGSNHVTTEYTLMADENTCTKSPNASFISKSDNWLFDLSQQTTNTPAASGSMSFTINKDENSVVSLASGTWYHVDLAVDVDARTVDYNIQAGGGDPVQGTYTVPDGVEMYATGLYFLGARYYPVQYFDNISVTSEVDGDFANTPTTTLSSINNQQRVYSLGFKEGETLHVMWNGVAKDYEFGDAEPNVVDPTSGTIAWSNNPNYDPSNEGLVNDACPSGSLEVWTTAGDAESEHVTLEVSNELVPVSAATAAISAVSAGYGKTYVLTADNSTVELAPTLYIDAKFTGKDASQSFTKSDLTSGATIELPGEGTLTLTTKAFGYKSVNSTVVNDIEYQQKADYNFAHWTDKEIAAAGFTADGNVTGNYANYGRLYWYNSATYDPSAEDNKKSMTAYSTIPQFTKKSSEWTDGVLSGDIEFTAAPTVNVHVFQGVGLNLEGKKGDNQDGNWISSLNLKINNLNATDFIMVSGYNNYGSNALHPVVASEEEFLARDNAPVISVVSGTTEISLYRVSDVIARLQVFSPAGETDGIANVNAADKTNADAPIYNLSGMRVNKNNLQKGIYIQNGKKFVVNK